MGKASTGQTHAGKGRKPFDLADIKNRIIETRLMRVGDLLDHPNQWRDHSGAQAGALAGALQEVGITDTIKAWYSKRAGGKLVTWDGHLRKSLDPDREWPVSITDLTDEEADYALATHDPIGSMAEANAAALDALLDGVKSGNKAVQQMLADVAAKSGLYLEPPGEGNAPAPEDQRADEFVAKWGVQAGQLWQLGPHRLIVADSTQADTVTRLCQGQKAALLLTDPPYNVGLDYGAKTDDRQDANAYEGFLRAWFPLWQHVSARQIVTPGIENLPTWLAHFPAFYVGAWTKMNSMGHGFVSQFVTWEPVLFLGGEWCVLGQDIWPRRRMHDTFDYPVSEQVTPQGDSLTDLHPCPKPVPMWTDLLEHYSLEGDLILDAFGGSGTCLVAAEATRRVCYCAEIEARFAAVSIERWWQMTNQSPRQVE